MIGPSQGGPGVKRFLFNEAAAARGALRLRPGSLHSFDVLQGAAGLDSVQIAQLRKKLNEKMKRI